jgi:hypothetical protein
MIVVGSDGRGIGCVSREYNILNGDTADRPRMDGASQKQTSTSGEVGQFILCLGLTDGVEASLSGLAANA